jgi:uncharacterized protein with GYD domain
MPIYIMLSKLTHEGRRTIKKHPERIEEVGAEMKKMGVKVLAQYGLLGPYDFLNIMETPGNEAITKVSIEFGSRGTVEIMTLAAITIEERVGKMAVPVESVPEEHEQLDG